VTTKAEFTRDEWDSLVQLPRWVCAAASAAQRDLAYRTTIEVEVGLLSSAHGRNMGNAFLAEVAADTLHIYDDRTVAAAIEFTDVESGIVEVLDRAAAVHALLGAKAAPADAAAYRHWLLTVTDDVISAARTGDFLGFGGKLVTAAEHRFRDRLATVLQA
jgi:hypothetical protein